MTRASRIVLVSAVMIVAIFAATNWQAYTQSADLPTNDAPDPYRTVEHLFKMPEGRTWGSTSAVAVDKDGKSIWIAERCGANSCIADPATGKLSDLPTIMKFDESGKMLKAFGAGMLVFPHGLTIDQDGNLWITDGQDNAPRAARGGGGGPAGPGAGATVGHQVYKFSPDGKLLMTLGKPGGGVGADYFFQPNAVLIAPNGDIYVSEGHASGANANARILKFARDGKFIQSFGKKGTGPGEFDQPHCLAMDSQGRLFVGDRANNRIQIFDQNFKYITEWKQFSRPSALYIDKRTDTIYVADSESGWVNPAHGAWKRGIRIGSAVTGQIAAFIPDPEETEPALRTSSAEGIAVDPAGNIYGAEVGQADVKKYVKK